MHYSCEKTNFEESSNESKYCVAPAKLSNSSEESCWPEVYAELRSY